MKKSFGAIIRQACIRSFPLAPSFAAIHEALIAADPDWKDIKQSSRETYRTDCMGTLRLIEPSDLRRMLALAGEEPRERSLDEFNSDYGIEPASPYDWASFYHAEMLNLARSNEIAASDEEIAEAENLFEESIPAALQSKGKGKGKREPIFLLPEAA